MQERREIDVSVGGVVVAIRFGGGKFARLQCVSLGFQMASALKVTLDLVGMAMRG